MKRFYEILLIGLLLTGGFLAACSQNEALNCIGLLTTSRVPNKNQG